MSLFEVTGLKKVYGRKFSDKKVEALRDVNFSIEEGEFVAIMGESGSGKTTLLNILALLDKPTEGKIYLKNVDLSNIADSERTKFRRGNLGYVFQDYNLLDTFNVKDNVLLPLVLRQESIEDIKEKLLRVLKKLGIESLVNKYPYELSGGEKQRVAVARALITDPKIIFADEPTGALDSKSADNLLEYFLDINKSGQSILMVTHSIKAASYASRILFIKDGRIFHQLYKGDRNSRQMYEEIANSLTQIGGE
ncbi:MAG: ABC transporter ATP-binding protein [Peptoniphilus sp.]|nr:ABC transporter ATP-binding protein [Peptoniphilus sp.]